MAYEYDISAWPVVQFKFVGRLDEADIERYFRDGDAIVRGDRSYACVMDGLAMLIPEVDFVRRQSQWIKRNEEDMRRVNRGIAFVATSAVVRGLVRAVLHLSPLPVPHAVFSELSEAMQWARQRALTSLVPRASSLPKE
jgi:hypothetical protein